MKQRIILGVGVAVLLVILLSACNPRSPNGNSSTTGNKLAGQQPAQSISSGSTPTVDAAVTGDTVPSYEEIENTIYHITHTKEHPEGPEVGPDGIVDQNIVQQLDSYNATLLGKKVEGWIGCAVEAHTSEPQRNGYNVGIYMDATKVGSEAFTEVTLVRLSEEQIQALGLVASTPPLKVCVRAKFSGTFDGVNSAGRVEIKNVTLAPIQ